MDVEHPDAFEQELARLTDLVEMLVETQVAALEELSRIRQRLEQAGAVGW